MACLGRMLLGRWRIATVGGVLVATVLTAIAAESTEPVSRTDDGAVAPALARPNGPRPIDDGPLVHSAPALSESSLDDAVRLLLCGEAREAVQHGRANRRWLEWITANAHRCPDRSLLFDAAGF